ncbi:transcriptional regulator [Nostoc sp. PCC 7524]|uniref:TetR/AcrR family transcriptional regulator n=1 Tax=Nostoc sp. (strain ATCC 29411 / PCC 7524) TaxID=28072 RepID=UPI00029F073F|nr:TetR/AcrR family transcriptional regulator [Nostoc sp. PCC 7524]AFY47840.1 transcriptional regulator [Nostoc sp. PCC 7524]
MTAKNPAKMRRQPQQMRSQERVDSILNAAEELFIEVGYEQTTTRAIATRAKVPVGSLYQFFPDKEAILKALATRYFQREYQLFAQLHTQQAETLPVDVYVDKVIDAFDHFMNSHPGYRAVYEQLLNLMTYPAIAAIDDYEYRIIDELAAFFGRLNPKLDTEKSQAIALVVVKVVGDLLWLATSQNPEMRQQLLTETKILMLGYLNNYLGKDSPQI